jgi:hypothetical protein
MFDSDQKSQGTRYTAAVALFTMAFIFCPAVFVASRPFGYVSLLLVMACSALYATLTWMSWRQSSSFFIPLPVQGRKAK